MGERKMKKTIKMILKEDFENTYQPSLKASDIIQKTAYFQISLEDQLEQKTRELKHCKLSFGLATVMSVILLLAVIGMGYTQWDLMNRGTTIKDVEVLTDEYYDYMLSINPYVSKLYQYTIRINDNVSMYIYKGLDIKKQESDYFYIVYFKHLVNEPITILIDSQEICLKKTSCGYLTKLSEEEKNALHFVINTDGALKEYTFEN